ncbi:hypothetical protein ACFP9V_18550 [Deinococcus radiopugnans]|uniref:Uncharacterized protein n=1 Tax=Deinococcus radiopugnans ATCC 19172 TaxID=585398 RepID=A0A5C4Y997_9DEIO|nr:hypothetical protein [Deinococcus radiopugnans]MBB6017440.1 hypothetical protein [Deinococcus radiopugnans ATCC 19172]TNM71971.1 hypothetical protein FHR04_06300 [Deinococcus radiopugnans ATCC 19172]
MTTLTLEQLQTQLDALVIAGTINWAVPEVMTLWDTIRAQQPDAWRDMCEWMLGDPKHDLLRALYRQCDTYWGATVPLYPHLAEQVSAMLPMLSERMR